MNRRRFLEIAAFSSPIISGCSASIESSTESESPTKTRTSSRTSVPSPTRDQTPTPIEASTETATQTQTPRENPATYFVHPAGSDDNSGSKESPLETIQRAVDLAQPGESVFVEPGQYFEMVETVRSGEPSNPITITGPAEAIISGRKDDGFTAGYLIRHSHIHITGTTIDGLQYPDRPDSLDSYIDYGMHTLPEQPSYLENLILKPEGIGNVTGPMVKINFVKNAEIGEFRTIGPSGLRYMLGDGAGGFGEIVYVGNSPPVEFNAIELTGELEGLDTSNNIHIHHIDNSAGYHHSELVNTKLGTHDVLVEYCTDGGGSQNDEEFPSASVRFQSYDATVRWCDLSNGHGHGIEIVSWNADTAQKEKDPDELTEAERKGGTENSAYGNRIMDFDDKSFSFPESEVGQGPEAQRYLCGNSFDSEAAGSPEKNCAEEVPTGDGVGHLGGDSPWA